jgi:hypothetical protein
MAEGRKIASAASRNGVMAGLVNALTADRRPTSLGRHDRRRAQIGVERHPQVLAHRD